MDTVWLVKDQSKNGTWLDGERMQPGKEYTLRLGAELRFGTVCEPYTVADLSPPEAALLYISGKKQWDYLSLQPIHALPDEANPEICIVLSDTGQWFCETECDAQPLRDGDIIRAQSNCWRFMATGMIEQTADAQDGRVLRLPINSIRFHFRVSMNEEHTFLNLEVENELIDLGERAHHYLLLTLARRRLADINRDIDEAEQGWLDIEELSKMLGLEHSHTNIQIFRARKQISDALINVWPLPQVIERRKGEVRFVFSNFTIVRGSEHEGGLCLADRNSSEVNEEVLDS